MYAFTMFSYVYYLKPSITWLLKVKVKVKVTPEQATKAQTGGIEV
jgi:hypothetical protein